jgi:acyl dehydratase
MPINPEAVGTESAPVTRSWTSNDALLYAVGVGAGTNELAFTTENTQNVPQRVLPTFAVILGGGKGTAMAGIGAFNPALLVHGEESIELFGEIPVEGTLSTVGRVAAIYDKGKSATVVVEGISTLEGESEPLFKASTTLVLRGEGGWGGDRGPSGPRNPPPEKAPDHSVTYQTSPDQALVYRLSGDRNPLHSDPAFAAMGGFDRPILHGLCTYGFTGRALLHTLADGDPAKVRLMAGRFSNPVFPGEALTVNMWAADEPGRYVFQTTGSDGRIVLDGGRFDVG